MCVAPQRIYATGKSNGGGFTALLACRLPHRIAASSTVAGAFYPETTQGCRPGRPVSIVDFGGTADPIVAYEGEASSHGEPLPALMDWIQDWADHVGPRPAPASAPMSSSSPSVTVPATPTSCTTVSKAPDTWPGELVDSRPGSATQTISTTAILWQFFLTHPPRG